MSWLTMRPAKPISFRLDRRFLPVFLIAAIITLAVMVISVGYGEYAIAPLDVIRAVLGLDTGNSDHQLVVRLFRLPRIVLALLVGAALGTSGAILQGITRNALADPGILGINNGAALAAVALLVYFKDISVQLLPWAAFGGALATAALIYLSAWRGGSSPIRLILIGIGFAAATQALTTLMVVFGDINDVQQAFVWLSGSVYGRGWDEVRTLLWWLVVLLPLSFLSARYLNTLALGDESATGLGLNVELQRSLLLDEPTTFLDLSHQIDVMDLLVDLNKRGSTIVTVLHDLNQAARYADQLVIVKAGEVYAEGSPLDVMTSKTIKNVFGLDNQVIRDPLSGTPLCIPIGKHKMNGRDFEKA